MLTVYSKNCLFRIPVSFFTGCIRVILCKLTANKSDRLFTVGKLAGTVLVHAPPAGCFTLLAPLVCGGYQAQAAEGIMIKSNHFQIYTLTSYTILPPFYLFHFYYSFYSILSNPFLFSPQVSFPSPLVLLAMRCVLGNTTTTMRCVWEAACQDIVKANECNTTNLARTSLCTWLYVKVPQDPSKAFN